MQDDEFFKAFMETGPQPEAPAPEMPNKPMYTRAEVDEIVARTIKSTMETMRGKAVPDPEEPEEVENEENNMEVNENEGRSENE